LSFAPCGTVFLESTCELDVETVQRSGETFGAEIFW